MRLHALTLALILLAAPPLAQAQMPMPDPMQAMQMAMRYYQMAAQAGDPEAQTKMGWMFENGMGVGKDMAEAAKWYQRAAKQKEPTGLYNLGLMFMKGQGVT